MFTMAETFPKEAPIYNRMGRAPFKGDSYLKGTHISDAVLMDDGHILIADQYGIAELDAQGAEIWRSQAPKGTEIHTIQPIGKNHVVYVLNAKPAKVVVMKISNQKIVHEFVLPYDEKGSVHGQFRNARLTSKGTLLVSNMAMGFVAEYKGVVGLAKTTEGRFEDGEWIEGRWLNGDDIQLRYDLLPAADEGFSGQGLDFDKPAPKFIKVELYKY